MIALFPFTWMAATSLKTNAELYNPKASPLSIQHPSLVHYIDLLKETNFLTWVANTMLVAVIATVISLLLGSMLAYPLARMRFRGAPLLAIAVAVTYLIPQTLLFVPMADLIGRMKLGNTLSAVMLTYPTLLVPFIAWLLMGYFKTVPKELEEQAHDRRRQPVAGHDEDHSSPLHCPASCPPASSPSRCPRTSSSTRCSFSASRACAPCRSGWWAS